MTKWTTPQDKDARFECELVVTRLSEMERVRRIRVLMWSHVARRLSPLLCWPNGAPSPPLFSFSPFTTRSKSHVQ